MWKVATRRMLDSGQGMALDLEKHHRLVCRCKMIRGRTTKNGKGPHAHVVWVDAKGNGLALPGRQPESNHSHEITKFRVLKWNNHTHELL